MADWGFRFTPDDSEDLEQLVFSLTEAFGCEPDDLEDESARWECRSGIFDELIAPVLVTLEFSGEVLSDGEASGGSVQEWAYESGTRTMVTDID